MPDILTILTHPTNFLAKTWNKDGTIKPYSLGKYFKRSECIVNNINEASIFLTYLEQKPNACLIRGQYIGDEIARKIDEQYKNGFVRRKKALFKDHPLHLVMIEVDDFEPSDNTTSQPVACITEYISKNLPEPFKGAAYHWQLSNSAGHESKKHLLKVHLWFYLKTPYTSHQLKTWAESANILCDKSVFNEVQIHYTSAPIFMDGVIDPVPVRSGFVEGNAEVDLQIIAPETNQSKKQEKVNPGAEDFTTTPEDRAKVQEALKNIPSDCEYTEWLAVLMALHYAFGDDGLPMAIEWSQKGTKYAAGVVQKKFNSFTRMACNPTTLGSLYKIANDYKSKSSDSKLNIINPATLEGKSVQQQEWIFEGWAPQRVVTSIYGDGGTGKSLLALQLSVCRAIGLDFMGIKTTRGKTLCIFCEDSEDEVHRRLVDITTHYGCSMNDLAENLIYICRDGEHNLLMEFNGKSSGITTEFYDNVSAVIQEHKPDLVVIDTAADTFGGNEINRTEVRQFIATGLMGLCKKHNCTILLCAHPSVAGKEGTGYSGSTAWNNSVRSRLLLKHVPESPNLRVLSKEKSNYSGIGNTINLQYNNGVFECYDNASSRFGDSPDHVQREANLKALIVENVQKYNDSEIRMSLSKNATNYAPKKLFKNCAEFKDSNIPEIHKFIDSLIFSKKLALVPHGRQGGQMLVVKVVAAEAGVNKDDDSNVDNTTEAPKAKKKVKKKVSVNKKKALSKKAQPTVSSKRNTEKRGAKK